MIQPPDVAADVGPSDNVEFTNAGLWIFSKAGAPLCTGAAVDLFYRGWGSSFSSRVSPFFAIIYDGEEAASVY